MVSPLLVSHVMACAFASPELGQAATLLITGTVVVTVGLVGPAAVIAAY
jgi:hypothetical protein